MKTSVSWTLFLAILITSTLSATLPVMARETANHTNDLSRRQCNYDEATKAYICNDWLPSLNQIKQRMWNTADGGLVTPDSIGLFWSGVMPEPLTPEGKFGTYMAMFDQLMRRGITASLFADFNALNAGWYVATVKRILERGSEMQPKTVMPPYQVFQLCYSQALAEAVLSEDVYYFIPDGKTWRDDSVWALIEYPALTDDNAKPKRIWRLDPKAKECAEPTLLWQRGQDKAVPFPDDGKAKCPVLEDHE